MKYFLFWEMVLYAGFMIGDLWNVPWSCNTDVMKYIAIVSCVIFAGIGKRQTSHNLQLALLYSVCADYFMLFTKQIWLGIVGFCCVQVCYWIAFQKIHRRGITQYQNGAIWLGGIFEFVLVVVIWTGIYRSELWREIQVVLIIVSAICYLGFSAWNLIQMNQFLKKMNSKWNKIYYSENEKESAILLFLGTFLLLVGDIYVGLNQLMPALGPAMWFFYLPSQVCIVMASKVIV